MFAVIETGGKQYKVQKDDILSVEKLSAKGGDKIQFNAVLLTCLLYTSPSPRD